MNKTYHVFSRNNDISGNPFRLVITFHNGKFSEAFESRSSEPNIISELFKKGYKEGFRNIHLTPAEYNSVKKFFLIENKIQHVH